MDENYIAAKILISNDIVHVIRPIFDGIKKNNGFALIVGGFVRDNLNTINPIITINDKIDIATNLTPEDAINAISSMGQFRFITQAIKFGSFIAINDHGQAFDITTMREDLSCDGRHVVVKYTDNLLKDSSRRDFTMNAMYSDIDGNIYDLHNGINDLRNGIVKFIGDTESRIHEDYLRILRYFRFSSIYAKSYDQNTLDIISKLSHHIKILSSERITQEVVKILMQSSRLLTIKLMSSCGIFKNIYDAWEINPQYLINLDTAIEIISISKENMHSGQNIAILALALDSNNIAPFDVLSLTRNQKQLLNRIQKYKWILSTKTISSLNSIMKSSQKNFAISYLSLNPYIKKELIIDIIQQEYS